MSESPPPTSTRKSLSPPAAELIGTSFTNGGPVWSIGGALAQPIFNGGALRAEKRKAVAAYEEAGANYQQVVLQAFEQVADSLRAIEHDAQTLQARTEAAAQAEATLQHRLPALHRRRHQPTFAP